MPWSSLESSSRLSPRRRLGLDLALLAIGALLLIEISTTALGAWFAETNPPVALIWNRNNPRALDNLAQQDLRASVSKNADAAQVLAQRALVQSPLQAEPLRLLGLIAESKGEMTRSGALMAQAEKQSWRDLGAQAWLLKDRFGTGDYEHAFKNADALLRADDSLSSTIFPVMIGMAHRPGGLEALEKRLLPSPPWRTAFLTALPASPDGLPLVLPILSTLKAGGSPPTEDELTPYLKRLLSEKRAQEAYISWIMLLPKQQIGALGNVFDGQFSLPISASPFDWVIDPSEGASVDVDTPPVPHDGKALHAAYNGFSPDGALIEQQIALAPGHYTLSGYALTAAPETANRLEWSVSCSGSNLEITAHGAPTLVASRWTAFSQPVDIPENDCAGQLLTLKPQPGERQTSVDVWYDDLALTPVR